MENMYRVYQFSNNAEKWYIHCFNNGGSGNLGSEEGVSFKWTKDPKVAQKFTGAAIAKSLTLKTFSSEFVASAKKYVLTYENMGSKHWLGSGDMGYYSDSKSVTKFDTRDEAAARIPGLIAKDFSRHNFNIEEVDA